MKDDATRAVLVRPAPGGMPAIAPNGWLCGPAVGGSLSFRLEDDIGRQPRATAAWRSTAISASLYAA